jgi:hypothetical protein
MKPSLEAVSGAYPIRSGRRLSAAFVTVHYVKALSGIIVYRVDPENIIGYLEPLTGVCLESSSGGRHVSWSLVTTS